MGTMPPPLTAETCLLLHHHVEATTASPKLTLTTPPLAPRRKRSLSFLRRAHADSVPPARLKHHPLLKGPQLGQARSDFELRDRLILCPAPGVDETTPVSHPPRL